MKFFKIRVFYSVVLPFLPSYPFFFREGEQQVSKEENIFMKGKKKPKQYYNGEFCTGFRAPTRKQNHFPAKAALWPQRGNYSDRKILSPYSSYWCQDILAHVTGKQNFQSEMFSVLFPVIFASMTFPLPLSLKNTPQLYSLSLDAFRKKRYFQSTGSYNSLRTITISRDAWKLQSPAREGERARGRKD